MKSILYTLVIVSTALSGDDILLKIKNWGMRELTSVIINNDRTFQVFETTDNTICKKGTINKKTFKEIGELINSKEVTSPKFYPKKEYTHCEGGTIIRIYLKQKEYVHVSPCGKKTHQVDSLVLARLKQIYMIVNDVTGIETKQCEDGYYFKLVEQDSASKNCQDSSLYVNIKKISKIPGAHSQNLKNSLKYFSLFYLGENPELEQALAQKRIIEKDKCFFIYLYKSNNSILEYVKSPAEVPPHSETSTPSEMPSPSDSLSIKNPPDSTEVISDP